MSLTSDLRAALAAKGYDVRGQPPAKPDRKAKGIVYLWGEYIEHYNCPKRIEVRAAGMDQLRADLAEVMARWELMASFPRSRWVTALSWWRRWDTAPQQPQDRAQTSTATTPLPGATESNDACFLAPEWGSTSPGWIDFGGLDGDG